MPRVNENFVVPIRSGRFNAAYSLRDREVYQFSDGWYVRENPYWQPAEERYEELCEDGTYQVQYPAREVGAAILERTALLVSFVEAVREWDSDLAESFSNFLGVECNYETRRYS